MRGVQEQEKVNRKAIDMMLQKAPRLKKISADQYSGWIDYCMLLNSYCDTMLNNKKNFNLAHATNEEINILKMYDRDVWLIKNVILKVIDSFVANLEDRLKKEKEKEEENNATN